jgi:hypothetical protein
MSWYPGSVPYRFQYQLSKSSTTCRPGSQPHRRRQQAWASAWMAGSWGSTTPVGARARRSRRLRARSVVLSWSS